MLLKINLVGALIYLIYPIHIFKNFGVVVLWNLKDTFFIFCHWLFCCILVGNWLTYVKWLTHYHCPLSDLVVLNRKIGRDDLIFRFIWKHLSFFTLILLKPIKMIYQRNHERILIVENDQGSHCHNYNIDKPSKIAHQIIDF
jgi:hypothetical protein